MRCDVRRYRSECPLNRIVHELLHTRIVPSRFEFSPANIKDATFAVLAGNRNGKVAIRPLLAIPVRYRRRIEAQDHVINITRIRAPKHGVLLFEHESLPPRHRAWKPRVLNDDFADRVELAFHLHADEIIPFGPDRFAALIKKSDTRRVTDNEALSIVMDE